MYQFPDEPKKIRARIARYERALRKEQAQYGQIDDGYGKRYLLGPLYMLLGDEDGAMRSFEWFEQTFPDDIGEPVQYLCWTLALYRTRDTSRATWKLRETMLSNLYLIPHLLGEDQDELDIWHGISTAEKGYLEYLPPEIWALWDDAALEWARQTYHSDEFRRVRGRYIEIMEQLVSEPIGPRRSRLVSEMCRLQTAEPDEEPETCHWTETQGQYLAFIRNYSVIHGEPPSERDMQWFFRVTPPSVHQMVLKLDELGFISREPGKARTIQVLVAPEELPILKDRRETMAKKSAAKAPIYQIKVTLEESKPPIWRRLLVPGDITLEKLHYVIQAAMGWTNSHLHQFIVGETCFGEPHPDYDDYIKMNDERRFRLKQITGNEGFEFRYEYDFGDSWTHTVLVEKILEPEPGQQYPVCVKGKRACPPEDVGGVWGYEEFLQALGDPDHPEHEEYLEWIGGEFDPEEFDLEETNAMLRRLR